MGLAASNISAIKTIRTLRAFRPLRAIKQNEGMKVRYDHSCCFIYKFRICLSIHLHVCIQTIGGNRFPLEMHPSDRKRNTGKLPNINSFPSISFNLPDARAATFYILFSVDI